jgi:hypothetical protein
MTARDIAHCRLINQQIVGAKCQRPSEIVSLLGAVQAQDYLGALWAIGLRSASSTEADIEQAIEARTIVRTWAMRGTLHFVASADVGWSFLHPRSLPPVDDGNNNWNSMTKRWRAAEPCLLKPCKVEGN